jgi:two-component sensor histidine kinase/CheY-like chemotaxis protein
MRRERIAPGSVSAAVEAVASIPKRNGHADALPAPAVEQLLAALQAVQAGDFSVRLPGHQTGIAGKVADTFNDIVSTNQRMARQLERVGDVVGKQGKTRRRVTIGSGKGAWGEMEASVNTLIDDLLWPTTEVTRAIAAVAKGDLLQTVNLDVDGRPLKGEFLRSANIVNAMIKQLRVFTSEVTRVAREVGTEGKLGGQVKVIEVTGVWKDLTESVNSMASNLTSQVRSIAEVTIAVANGDLSKKITVDVRGEILQLKEAINSMVDQLRSFASEVTRVTREVDHRAKNTLAVVQAIIRMAKRDTVEDYVKAVEGRIGALAQTHELLSQCRWEGADILRLILDELAPYQGEGQQRVTAVGPALVLLPGQAQLLAMAIHELATNAAKYGSLSVNGGRVDVSWSIFEGLLTLVWRESKGPKAERPKKIGFGTRLISGLGAGRRGRTEFDWRPSGLTFTLELQLRDLVGDGIGVKDADSQVGPRLLLVEDELVVGMFMQEALESIGYRPTNPIGHLAEAVAAAKTERFLGAVLDMNLHGEIVYPLAELLTSQRVPFLFVTGYAPHTIDARFSSIPILHKPVLEEQLAMTLKTVLGRQPALAGQGVVLG